ncbi:hypothetical protein [Bradyrhizobium sp.]|uniref:hypothetical protein n=1 Tax=Bradyrhizobium sp. TaxID=376 RepID=UPI003C77EBFE
MALNVGHRHRMGARPRATAKAGQSRRASGDPDGRRAVDLGLLLRVKVIDHRKRMAERPAVRKAMADELS